MLTATCPDFDLSTPEGRLVKADWHEENGEDGDARLQRITAKIWLGILEQFTNGVHRATTDGVKNQATAFYGPWIVTVYEVERWDVNQGLIQAFAFTVRHKSASSRRWGRWSAGGFSGSADTRNLRLGEWCQEQAHKEIEKEDRRAAQKKARDAFVNPYKPGDVLYYSWGYDQTNIDFFQVVKAGKRSITVREIASRTVEATGSMSARVAPVKDHFVGEPVTKILQPREGGRCYISMDHGCLSPVGDRQTFDCSWYH